MGLQIEMSMLAFAEEAVGLPALSDVYEVDKVLDMRVATEDGHREFLVKWKGWGPKWNNGSPGSTSWTKE